MINTYGTIGNGMKPPFTTIVKYDLNVPAIKWRVGFGDDPALIERGVTGTGVTQMRNSIIITESGLIFGAGRDNQIRAWDSDTGKTALVVAVRRKFRRLACDVRDGRQAVSAGACGKYATAAGAAVRARRQRRPAVLKLRRDRDWADGLGRVCATGEIAERCDADASLSQATGEIARVFCCPKLSQIVVGPPLVSSAFIRSDYRLSVGEEGL